LAERERDELEEILAEAVDALLDAEEQHKREVRQIAERLAATLTMPFGPSGYRWEDRMGSFAFTLERENGTPVEPPTLQAAVPNWRPGHVIALGAGRSLRVIDTRLRENSDGDPVMVLVVEPA
jgi:hypothetical protein